MVRSFFKRKLFLFIIVLTSYSSFGKTGFDPVHKKTENSSVLSKNVLTQVGSQDDEWTDKWLYQDSMDVLEFCFGDTSGQIIYAATRNHGVRKSEDGGTEWSRIGEDSIKTSYIRSNALELK